MSTTMKFQNEDYSMSVGFFGLTGKTKYCS